MVVANPLKNIWLPDNSKETHSSNPEKYNFLCIPVKDTLDGSRIAASKQVQMINQVVQVINRISFFIAAIKRTDRKIGCVKSPG